MLNRTLRLKIKAMIFPESTPTSPVVCDPKSLYLLPETVPHPNKIVIKNITMDTMAVKLVYTDDEYFDAHLTGDILDVGGRLDVVVNVRKDRKEEYFKKSFTVEFDDAAKTRMSIPVSYVKTVNSRTKQGN